MRVPDASVFRPMALALTVSAALAVAPPEARPQSAPPDFKAEFLGQFGSAAQRLLSLAEAMPAETYDWRPMEGVASVAEAYMHIARYNYYYPATSLGIDAPADVDYEQLEGVVNAKENVIPALRSSLDHVRQAVEAMSSEALEAPTELYGREVASWSVLLQLVTHMNQHLGQEIAYARMNRIVPPWSR